MPAATKKRVAVKRTVKSNTTIAPAMTSMTSAYVPSIEVQKKYVARQLPGGIWDLKLFDFARENAYNILLMGDTGSGKTLVGEAYAAHYQVPYYSLPCDVSIDPGSLFGKMVPTEEAGVYEFQDGPVTELVRNGGVLNVSEINFMPPKIAASLYPLLDDRRYIPLIQHKGEIVRAHIGTKAVKPDGTPRKCWCGTKCDDKVLLIVCDMNPNYRGTMELNDAFKNRFKLKLTWNYDDAVEEQLIKSPALREAVGKLRKMRGTELRTPVSTNMAMEFERFSDTMGIDFAAYNFINAFAADERPAIEKVVELHKDAIVRDLKYIANGNALSDDELDEVDFEFEQED